MTAKRGRPAAAGVRESILDAAAALLSRDEGEGFAIKEVAQEAGVAVGLIYHYFRDKDALLLAVADGLEAGFAAEKNPLRPSTPGVREVQRQLETRRSWYRLRQQLFALALRRKAMRPRVARLLSDGRAWIGAHLHVRDAGTCAVVLAALDGLALQKLADPRFDDDAAYRALEKLLRNS